jgi:HPt (histidine-containing phosphotransfer) domain-containing protein
MLLARWTKARRFAHSLKGTALTVAAEGVAQAAAVLEQVGPGPTGQGEL